MCPRCTGLLVQEPYYDGEVNKHLYLTRCVNCGFRHDPQMQANRNTMPPVVRKETVCPR